MLDASPAPITPRQPPGEAIRALRKRLGLTLGEVSKRTGMSVSTLSKLEKGHASLSYEKLHLIARGLNVDMSQVIAPAGNHSASAASHHTRATGRRTIQRSGEGLPLGNPNYGTTYLATELLNKRLIPMITTIQARSIEEFLKEFGDFVRHPGEEFSYVIEGQVEFHTELYAPVVLNAGDSIYFDGNMGHAYLAVGDMPSRLLTVCESAGSDHPGKADAHEARPSAD